MNIERNCNPRLGCVCRLAFLLVVFTSVSSGATLRGWVPPPYKPPTWPRPTAPAFQGDPDGAHKFTAKCTESKSPSGDGLASVVSGTAEGEVYDDRTDRGQTMLRQLEAQGGVLWKVMLVNQNGGVGAYSFYRKHESAKREVARILKELANPNSYWHWWMKVTDAFVEADMNCGNTNGSTGDLPWLAGLKKINPNASPELLRLTADALVEPPRMWYQNYIQSLIPAFIAQQGGGLVGDALFKGVTGNFYPASGSPGGVIGEYAQLFSYNLGMLAQLRNLFQTTLDNGISGVGTSLDQLQEGIRFAEQLEGTHTKYLMPTPKSFTAGDYRQLTSEQFLEAVGPELFEPFMAGQYIFFPPDPEAEQASVRVAPTAGGFEVTATSATDPGRSIRVVLPDLGSWFDPADFVPGGADDEGIYSVTEALPVTFTASRTNSAVKNGTKFAGFYSYFFPGFVRWVEGDSVTSDPVLSGIRDYWRTNPIAIDPLTTGAWAFTFSEPDGSPAGGMSDLVFFYRADGKHLVYFSGELPSQTTPQIATVGLQGLGQVNPANSLDDRVPLRITVSPTNDQITLPVGGTLSLTGTILGQGPVTNVKWRANYVVVQSDGMSLTKSNMQPHHSGFYTLTASNAYGLASSMPVLVQVKGGPKDANANLLDLKLAGADELSPSFVPAVRSYAASLPSNSLTTTVTPSVEADAQIKVRINDGAFQSVASGATSQPLALSPGSNTVDVQVTASDGKTQKTYSIGVTRSGTPTATPTPTPSPTPPNPDNDAETFSATDVPRAIPDKSSRGLTSIINIASAGKISAMTVSANVTHPFKGDLRVTLISPGGTRVVLHDRTGYNEQNVVLVDVPVTAFDNASAAGQWSLLVQDLSARDTGILNSWSLEITTSPSTPTPTPSPVETKAQKVTFKLPPKMVYGGEYILRAKFSAKGPVTYVVNDTTAAEVFGSKLTILKANAPFKVTARHPGDATWKAAQIEVEGSAAKRPQKIAFTTKGVRKVEETFPLSVTVNSELDVTVTSSNPQIVRINDDGTATALAKGNAELTATRPGDDNHLPAKPVTRNVTVK